ncbi:MAG: 4-(cytidine 5'-diphospho)-2-C-methyl-D-erythritol kinase [Lachnospiraceae bacterium]|nr:4-(cytidine 5'-diphospho)-2-C-methyl-D-erythritol kinase [Lachnospiraceae bacterium]
MIKLEKKAYAKVNLALDVLGKREDGYHEVKMIMQNISLCDELIFTVEKSDKLNISLTSNKDNIPLDENNLVHKAVASMCERYDIHEDICVHIEKNIPVEAGMAGGSTDCATAIHAMNELFSLKLSLEEMMKIGVKLGADVPYCIMAHTALSEGIGEKLAPVTPLRDCFVLVAKPKVSVSTGMVYKSLRCDELKSHPDVDGMIEALAKNDLEGVSSRLENVLETVTIGLYPIIEKIKDIMKERGALNAVMSGSGPTVFGIYRDREQAESARSYIIERNISNEVYVTEPVS